MKTFKTKKGTELSLISLKGKDYMQVQQRLVWFCEEIPMYHISTTFLTINETEAVAQSTIVVLNEQGQAVRRTMATKRETLKDFADYIEKAETGSLGRALAQLGYGTQFAHADLDESHRIVDAPVIDTRPVAKVVPMTEALKTEPPVESSEPVKKPSFRKTKKVEPVVETPVAGTPVTGNNGEDWLS